MTNETPDPIEELLPWYLNGTLPAELQAQVAARLQGDPSLEAQLRAARLVHRAVRSQPHRAPAADLQARLLGLVGRGRVVWTARVLGVVIALALLALLWLVMRPGVVLEWQVAAGEPAKFNVYRAAKDQAEFTLLSEVPAAPQQRAYRFVDRTLWPVGEYVYRIEAVQPDGASAIRQVVAEDGWTLMLTALAILWASVVAGYSVAVLAAHWPRGRPPGLGRGAY